MHRQILLGLRIRHAALLDQPHSLKLELARKLPTLHDAPPVPLKHLTWCLRNRVQAKWTLTWEDTPDGRGKFYEPKNGFRGRVEVVGWDDLIGDARERNSAVFARAGLNPRKFFSDQD